MPFHAIIPKGGWRPCRVKFNEKHTCTIVPTCFWAGVTFFKSRHFPVFFPFAEVKAPLLVRWGLRHSKECCYVICLACVHFPHQFYSHAPKPSLTLYTVATRYFVWHDHLVTKSDCNQAPSLTQQRICCQVKFIYVGSFFSMRQVLSREQKFYNTFLHYILDVYEISSC